jgi:hypothetical protein
MRFGFWERKRMVSISNDRGSAAKTSNGMGLKEDEETIWLMRKLFPRTWNKS